MILSQKTDVSGTSLIEATIAACTAALFLASLFTLNMTGMKTIRTARETTAASQVLQQRVESMRIANWHQATDADWLKDSLFSAEAAGSNNLKGFTETLTLEPYGSDSVGNTKIVRSNGTTQIVNRNSSLLNESAMKVIWTVDYSGALNSRSMSPRRSQSWQKVA